MGVPRFHSQSTADPVFVMSPYLFSYDRPPFQNAQLNRGVLEQQRKSQSGLKLLRRSLLETPHSCKKASVLVESF